MKGLLFCCADSMKTTAVLTKEEWKGMTEQTGQNEVFRTEPSVRFLCARALFPFPPIKTSTVIHIIRM